MKNMKKRILATLLSLSMAMSALSPMGTVMNVSAASELVNIAVDGTAHTDNTSGDNTVISSVNDGNDATVWTSAGQWPTTAVVQLNGGHTVSKVVVKLGGDDNSARSVDVTVRYAQNGVTDTLLALGSKQDVSLSGESKTVTFDLAQNISATHIYVELSDPKDNGATGVFWACISEIEVYESQEVTLSNYNNIANQAVIETTGSKGTTDAGKLVDQDDTTLYGFHEKLTDDRSITLKYAEPRTMDAFRIAFEKLNSDSSEYSFVYSIEGKKTDGEYVTIVSNAQGNRTKKWQETYQIAATVFSEIKITMHGEQSSSNLSRDEYKVWPAIAEFEVYGSEIEVNDGGSIAFRKPVRAASGKSTASNVTDGSTNTTWKGEYYPAYVDIDLEKNYYLDTVEIFTPENGYSQYSIYTSLNGRDFAKLAEKTSKDSASLETGEVYQANGKEARIIRIYMEYNSTQVAPVLNEVRATGRESSNAVQQTPAVNVVNYADSKYAEANITTESTYAEVYGIIERRLGAEYKEWFSLQLADSTNGYDYYELSNVNGKVHVKGNDGVSLATGINHFLKYYCNVNISQVGDQVKMPASIPVIDGTVHKETKAKVRYSYNYCTLSYSMAFWGEKEWRDELDWLALNGVNVVLDATAQEEVWRRFLGKLGYSHADAKDFIAGPAYYAWAYMANLSGFGGPVHDSWFEERTELARKNQQIMRTLGMQPVLQGYSGMVPTDIVNRATGTYALTSSDVIGQGLWCSFQRPAMLKTTNPAFEKYAELFYKCQEEVYGDVSDYYATDPFHEGGNTGGMNSSDIAEEVLKSMLAADPDSVWIIQAWQGNPTTALLNGLDRVENGAQHAMVLDLYAEKTPHYNETGDSYGDTREFDDTPWLFCMLNNFGGRLGLHGHLDNLANNIPTAFNTSDDIAGIGIAPEASVNNPVLYDFLFETIWQEDASQNMTAIDLDEWLADYTLRRYGAESDSANEAWAILKETVYKSSLNNLGQGAPESVVNARPALDISAASTWGNAVISYDKLLLEEAAELLLEDYDVLKSSKGYMYDVANVLQQVLSNSAQEYQRRMTAAYNAGEVENFKAASAKFLEIIGYMEKVTATSEYFLLGRWIEQAKDLAESAVKAGDDFTVELYEMNARALITTWGSYNQAESGGLKDYSNRQWSGLIGDFYKPRWERWITARTNELEGKSYENSINWFQWEWEWVRSNEEAYITTPKEQDFVVLGAEILDKYTAKNPAADDSRDVEKSKLTISDGNHQQGDSSEGAAADFVYDNNPNTLWHTEWNGTSDRSGHYVIFEFNEATTIDGMRFLQRQTGSNGLVKKFDLYVKTANGGDEWQLLLDDGILSTDKAWQLINLPATEVTAVKFQVVDAVGDGRIFSAAAEIRFTESDEEGETPDTPKAPDEIVEVEAGKSITIVKKGNASLTADEVELDTNKAKVAVTNTYVQDVAANTYRSSDKTYSNTPIWLSKCLHTFTLKEDGTYEITGIAEDGETIVYVNPRVPGRTGFPHTKEAESIQVIPQEGGGYKLIDNSQQDYWLTYKSVWNVFNEDEKNASDATTVFHLYRQVMTVDENGNTIYTYEKANDLGNTDVTARRTTGQAEENQYVIVAELSNGDKYVLRPSTDTRDDNDGIGRNSHVVKMSDGTLKEYTSTITIKGITPGTTTYVTVGNTKYEIRVTGDVTFVEKDVTVAVGDTLHIFDQSGMYDTMDSTNLDENVAGVTVESKTINDLKANLFENKNTYYTGDEILLSSCLYTFNKNIDGTYRIMAVLEDGTTVYVNPRTEGKEGYPNTETEESIRVEATENGTFKLQDATETAYYLTYKAEWYVFNETQSNGIKEFKLYELVETAEGSGVYEYREATEVKDGGQYAIVAEYTDGSGNVEKYVLRPSNDQNEANDGIGRNSHVAKLSDKTEEITGTAIRIDGLSADTTSVKVGNTDYQITVNELPKFEKKLTLMLGQTKDVKGVVLIGISDENVVLAEQKADQSGYTMTAAGTGTATVEIDRTIYHITVKEERTIEMKIGDVIVLDGDVKSGKPDVDVISVVKTDEGYEVTALDGGETTFEIDYVIYHISVIETQVASAIGTSRGQEVTKLIMSANNSFDLDMINLESGTVEWKIVQVDKDGNETVATWAKVTENGVVSATDPSNHVDTFNGYIVATVTAGEESVEYRTALEISPAPTAEALRLYDIYIGETYHTELYYGWLYGYDVVDKETGEASVAYGYSKLSPITEGELIYVSMGANYNNAIDFFAKPDSGYALTQMGATGSAGHYMRLEGETPEETEFISKSPVAGYVQYNDINREATAGLVQLAMLEKCHGAQGFTRKVHDGTEGVKTILDYRSEKLPTVRKSVYGIGTGEDYRPYTEGATAQIGEYIYFKVTVDTYPITGMYLGDNDEPISDKEIVEYINVELEDLLDGAVFIPFENIGKENPIAETNLSKENITEDILGEEVVGQTHEYYVAYQLQAKDIASIEHKLTNTVKLATTYETYYSSGVYEGDASDEAEILITTEPWSDQLVVDFGLPVVYEFETTYEINTGMAHTKYGHVYTTTEQNGVVYKNTIVYTPTNILMGMDEIPLVPASGGALEIIEVYPANTVYYEERFAAYSEDQNGNCQWEISDNPAFTTQALQFLREDENGIANYGYDEAYNKEAGPSNQSEAVSTKGGNSASFKFTGTGVDIYANCLGGEKPTGTISVLVKNSEGGLVKMMVVDTGVAGSADGITSAQNQLKSAYNLPVVSLSMTKHDMYEVFIYHTRIKDEDPNDMRPIKLDGIKVYHTLEDESVYEVHKETGANFLEMRNAVLGAVNLSEVLPEPTVDENGNKVYPDNASIYASNIAGELSQVYEKEDALKDTFANAYIVMNDGRTDQLGSDSAKDLLDNGPKNELFLYPGESLIFGLAEGLSNVQLGMKAVNAALTAADTDAVSIEKVSKTVSKRPEVTVQPTIETVYEIAEIDGALLAANAKSNSEQRPAKGTNDGYSEWAFDDETHWWHSRYNNDDGQKADYEVDSGLPAVDNEIWIETGFDAVKKIAKISYASRSVEVRNIGKEYVVQAAKLENPLGTPEDSDYTEVTRGTFANTSAVQEVVFPQIVEATHIRLVFTSVQHQLSGFSNHVTAERIRVYEQVEKASDAGVLEKVYSKYVPDFNAAQPIADGNYIIIGANQDSSYGHVITRSNNLTESWPLKHSEETKFYVQDGTENLIEKDCSDYEWKFYTTRNGVIVSFTTADGIVKYLNVPGSSTQLISGFATVNVVSNGDERYSGKGAVSIGTSSGNQYLNWRSNDVQTWGDQNNGGNGWYLYAAKYRIKANDMNAAIANVASQEDYTAESWNAYDTALRAAGAMFATEIEAAAAYNALVKAVAGLTLKPLKETTKQLGIEKIKSSTDMFYCLGDTETAAEGEKVETTITITNNSDKVLSVTKMKYFTTMEGLENPLTTLSADDFIPMLKNLGYQAEKTPEETKTSVLEIFTDVEDAWYKDPIQFVYDKGYMTGIGGTTEFRPNANITKAQVVQIFYNIENRPKETDRKVFEELSDVSEGQWYSDAVAWAYHAGVITGDNVLKRFNPNASITREQLAIMLYKYAQMKQYDTSQRSDFAGLLNVDRVNSWAKESMSWAVGARLISGISKGGAKDLAPTGNATRAQMAVILQNFFETYENTIV